jgi:hypothetical protein
MIRQNSEYRRLVKKLKKKENQDKFCHSVRLDDYCTVDGCQSMTLAKAIIFKAEIYVFLAVHPCTFE